MIMMFPVGLFFSPNRTKTTLTGTASLVSLSSLNFLSPLAMSRRGAFNSEPPCLIFKGGTHTEERP